MQHALSRKQMEALRALEEFIQRHGHIPSVRELAASLDRPTTTVFQYLTVLARKGYVKRDGSAHGWRVLRSVLDEPEQPSSATDGGGRSDSPSSPRDPELSSDPSGDEPLSDAGGVRVFVHGTVVAGAPLEAVEDRTESYVFPRGLVSPPAFALRVRGSSMQDDSILHDDLVLVKPQRTARDGDVVVALLEDGTATLKRLFRERSGKYAGTIRLQPANSEMDPIYVRKVEVQGKVVGVWRNLR